MTQPFAAVKNASDPKQVEAAQQKVESREERAANDLLFLLEHPQFRRFAWRHIATCGVFQVADPGAAESVRAFTDGKRIIGNTLLQAIQAVSIDGYLLMQREALTEEQSNASRNRSRRRGPITDRPSDTDDTRVRHTADSANPDIGADAFDGEAGG